MEHVFPKFSKEEEEYIKREVEAIKREMANGFYDEVYIFDMLHCIDNSFNNNSPITYTISSKSYPFSGNILEIITNDLSSIDFFELEGVVYSFKVLIFVGNDIDKDKLKEMFDAIIIVKDSNEANICAHLLFGYMRDKDGLNKDISNDMIISFLKKKGFGRLNLYDDLKDINKEPSLYYVLYKNDESLRMARKAIKNRGLAQCIKGGKDWCVTID